MQVRRSHARGSGRSLVVAALALTAFAFSMGVPFGWDDGSRALAQTAVAAGDFQWQTLGARTYDTSCGGCHQRSGRGIAGGFPPLAGHAPEVFAQKGGAFLARLVLFGMTGPIEVEGTQYNGNMPAWADSLKDDEIAAVIDHVLTAWDNEAHLPKDFKPIVPADIAAARDENKTAEQVCRLRAQLSRLPRLQSRQWRVRRPAAQGPIVRAPLGSRQCGSAVWLHESQNAARPSRPAQ
jgi:mono/diheme cytochrome c family protein